ncbi:MAG: hypothetical protein IJX17_07250, partial [Clostridia bacterium]|nr:hypothetical protein [Clostridia bacterium]
DDKIICEDTQIINGKIEIDSDVFEGNYVIKIFEVFEDDSGFDNISIKLGEYDYYLIDLYGLEKCQINILNIQDIDEKYAKIFLNTRYYIRDLQLIGNIEEFYDLNKDIPGLYRFDLYEDDVSDLIFYSGNICIKDLYGDFKVCFKVLVIFYNQTNINDLIILRECNDEFLEIIYDNTKKFLLREEVVTDNLIEKYTRNLILTDDKYKFNVSFQENTNR